MSKYGPAVSARLIADGDDNPEVVATLPDGSQVRCRPERIEIRTSGWFPLTAVMPCPWPQLERFVERAASSGNLRVRADE